MRLTRIGLIRLAWVVALAVIPTLASAQTPSVGKNGDVTFDTAVRVGMTTLGPGDYRFQHRVENGQHYLLVSRLQRSTEWLRQGQVVAAEEVARTACTVAEVNQKNKKTEVTTQKDDAGATVLMQIQIAGENASHTIAHQM